MSYTVKDISLLKKLLWLDTLLGASTAIVGLLFFNILTSVLGLTTLFILSVSIITFCYSVIAFILANQNNISVPLLITLICANWIWTLISIGLCIMHFDNAELLGKIFLFLQIIVVGGLAYLEGKQITVVTDRPDRPDSIR